MGKWVRILGIVAAVAVLASVVGVGLTMAADPQPGNPAPLHDVFLGKLAARLNVSLDQLKAAITGARSDTLQEAVSQGRITEQQKSQMEQRLQQRGDSFGFGPGMMGGGFGRGMMGRAGGAYGTCPGWGNANPSAPTPTPPPQRPTS